MAAYSSEFYAYAATITPQQANSGQVIDETVRDWRLSGFAGLFAYAFVLEDGRTVLWGYLLDYPAASVCRYVEREYLQRVVAIKFWPYSRSRDLRAQDHGGVGGVPRVLTPGGTFVDWTREHELGADGYPRIHGETGT